MDQNISPEWTVTERIIFRLSFCYLVFYFLFLSSFFVSLFPIVGYIHKPLGYISDSFVGLINNLIVHHKFEQKIIYKNLADSTWSFMACLSYFSVAIIVTVGWTLFDKRKAYLMLFTYLQTYARYYLAFVLFVYDFAKLYEQQFGILSGNLIKPLGNIDSHTLLWTFMGSSLSYNFFAGIVEILAGLLLLFRRTTALGALIALGSLTNILIIDIAYDTLVKFLVSHLILISLFILSPDIKRLFHFFISKPNVSLATVPLTPLHQRFRPVQYTLKFLLITYMLYTRITFHIESIDQNLKRHPRGINGVYKISEFFHNGQSLPPLTTDLLRWKNFSIEKYDYGLVQFMNDSSVTYSIKIDSISKSISFTYWNDSTFKSKLSYTAINPSKYHFEGTYKNDSISFTSDKIDLNLPLLRDKGKIKWVWW